MLKSGLKNTFDLKSMVKYKSMWMAHQYNGPGYRSFSGTDFANKWPLNSVGA